MNLIVKMMLVLLQTCSAVLSNGLRMVAPASIDNLEQCCFDDILPSIVPSIEPEAIHLALFVSQNEIKRSTQIKWDVEFTGKTSILLKCRLHQTFSLSPHLSILITFSRFFPPHYLHPTGSKIKSPRAVFEGSS